MTSPLNLTNDKIFKGEYNPFYLRLFKKISPVILIAFIAVLNVFYGGRSGIFADYKIEFSVVMGIAATIGFFYHMNRIRTVVTEVQISDSKFKIFGYDFNSKFEDDLDLSKTYIEVVEEYVGKNNSVYCLEIMCEDKFYYINKSSDWNYQVLIDLINEYSLKTGRVIPSFGLLKGTSNGA